MWRIAFFFSVLTVTAACGDIPGAPSAKPDRPALQEGDPPPPPLDDGDGRFDLAPSEAAAAVAGIGTQQECVPPVFVDVDIEGEYFQNKTEKVAWIHFKPVPGSGSGTIQETSNDPDQKAAGTLVVEVPDPSDPTGATLQQYEIHLRDYQGTTLFAFTEGEFFGFTSGALEAEVTACGGTIDYEGDLQYSWFCEECKFDNGF
jgi:hypothetical protein